MIPIRGRFDIAGEMTHGGEDRKADKRSDATCYARLASIKVFNGIQAAKCGAKVHSTQNHLSDVHIADAGSIEDYGALI